MDRFNQIDYNVQSERLVNLYNRFKPYSILAERNSMGEPIIDALRARGLPIQGFQTTAISKAQIITQLMLAFEQNDIKILNNPVLVSELQNYEAVRLPGGSLRYSAPDGQHDDTVMALALAIEEASRQPLQVVNYRR